MNSQRYDQSKAAYNEVRERHKDIQKIEQTITELAQLFNDVSPATCFKGTSPDGMIIR